MALVTVQDGKVKTSLKDVVISLDGPSTIVGHSVVVHFGQDDLKSQVGSLVSISPCQSSPISQNCLLVRFAVCQQVTNVTFKRAHAFEDMGTPSLGALSKKSISVQALEYRAQA
jgi:hypothetical protein